jgi:hypothetical protein
LDTLLETVSLLTVEEKLSQWRSSAKRGKGVPFEIKQQVVSLLSEHKYQYLQRKLGLSCSTLKAWQLEVSSQQTFVALPPEKIRPSEELTLKFSRSNEGTWSIEGTLPLKSWQSVIRLLEGVR